jgi:hypothetical protein
MKKELVTETATAPSEWASYLINDDPSGLEDKEIEAADAWIDRLGWGTPIDCEDVGFCVYHDAWPESRFAGDCSVYTFLR